VTRETVAINVGRDGNHAAGRPDLPQGPYWDLDLLTPDDVCALLKVKKSWLYDAVENGALEAIRLGKQLRFRPSALVRYLEERVSNGNGTHAKRLALPHLSEITCRSRPFPKGHAVTFRGLWRGIFTAKWRVLWLESWSLTG
jgi:excisionase family DNA binding protein